MATSPGITKSESSVSTTAVSDGTGGAGIVGIYQWGPAFSRVTVSDETDLVATFGESDDRVYNSFWNANNYLNYGSNLDVVRVVDEDTAKNMCAIYHAINYTIGSTSMSGYAVDDEITVSYSGTAVTVDNLGKVTAVDSDGAITSIFIPSAEIIAYMTANSLTDLDDFTVSVSTSSGGSGASITLSLVDESPIYFPNISSANSALTATDDDDIQAMSEKLGYPVIAGIYPGDYNDVELKVYICTYADYTASVRASSGVAKTDSVTCNVYPDGGTTTLNFKEYLDNGPANSNQYGVIVTLDGVVKENFLVSTESGDTNTDDVVIYIDTYFANGASSYIYMIAEGFIDESAVYTLGGGVDTSITAAAFEEGWDLFSDVTDTDVEFLIGGATTDQGEELSSTVSKYIATVLSEREFGVGFISPPEDLLVDVTLANAITNLVAWRSGATTDGTVVDSNFNTSSDYCVIDANYKKQYDSYTDTYRWISFSGDMAGLCANIDDEVNCAHSPAGVTYGQISNVEEVAIVPKKSQRGSLYEVEMNPIKYDSDGTYLYGDKTAVSSTSKFTHINVRRVFNLIEKNVTATAKTYLFENNTDDTRTEFRTAVNDYLSDLVSSSMITDGYCVCDTSNNTSTVIDNNQFVAAIYVKPVNSINYITLNFVKTGQDYDFSSLES